MQATPLISIDNCARFVKIARPLLEQLPRGVFRDMMFDRLSQVTYRRRTARPAVMRLPTPPLSQPAEAAMALLRYRPDLLPTIGDVAWLSKVQGPGVEALIAFIAFLRAQPLPDTNAIEDYFNTAPVVTRLPLYTALSEQGLAAELLGAVQNLARLGKRQLTEKLLAKAQKAEGLSALEKDYLKQLLQSLESRC